MFPDFWGTGYKIVLFLHIASMFVAMAPGFVWPVVSVQLKKAGKPVGPSIGALAEGNTKKLHLPALILGGLFGFALVGMSKPDGAPEAAWKFSQTWVSVAAVCWVLMVGLVAGMMMPAERKAAAGDEGAEKIISAVGGVLHLLMAIILAMMIFKPGV